MFRLRINNQFDSVSEQWAILTTRLRNLSRDSKMFQQEISGEAFS